MEFVKFFTPAYFQNEKFCQVLWNHMNVRCKPVEDGVILDREAFNMMPLGEMPTWCWMNHQDINSPLHTRPATPDEWPELNPKTRYVMGVMYDFTDVLPLENADGFDYMVTEAQDAAEANRDDPEFVAVVIVDKETGKVVYKVK